MYDLFGEIETFSGGTISSGLVDASFPMLTATRSKELRFQFFHKALVRKAS